VRWATVLVVLAVGVQTLAAGEPEDTWMKAIRSGTVTSAWASAEGGQVVQHGLDVLRNAGVEGVLSNGLAEDGREVMLVESSDPKYTGPTFIYGNVPDWLRPSNRVEIVVEYFDAGPGTISINYSNLAGGFAAARTPIELAGCKRWRVARVTLLDADFKKVINGCDFRILTNRRNFQVRTVAVVPLGELDKVPVNLR
jgi:hypothetical protein